MTRGDIAGLILSYAWAFGMLASVEALGRRFGCKQVLTRKIIHIGAGMWVWGLLLLFDHWYWGLIPFATFILLNYVFYRRQTFEAMDDERSSPGTVYFAISIILLLALLWRTGGQPDWVPFAVAPLMAMIWGDALAAIIGMDWGRRPYTVFGHTRTLEGSAAMAASSFVAMLLTLHLLPGSALSPNSLPLAPSTALLLAAVGTLVATLAEALSPAGTDNLSVPLLSAASILVVYGRILI
jgi:phytol kinase